MFPTLAKIGPLPINTYGFLIAVGFLVSAQVAKRLAIREKVSVEKVLDLTFWGLIIGFLGARILFIITRWSFFVEHPLDMFKVWEGGLVFFGGPIAVIPFLVWFLRRNKLQVWKTMDLLTPCLVIGHAFGRMGCFAAGCCYGKPTDLPWGVRFYSDLVERHYHGVPLHPTQLYESLSLFMLFCGLLYIHRKRIFDGQVLLTYLMVYPVIRSVIEVFRGDLVRGFVVDDMLSTSQFISILVFVSAVCTLIWRLKSLTPKKINEIA